jgi:hypothetical protein
LIYILFHLSIESTKIVIICKSYTPNGVVVVVDVVATKLSTIEKVVEKEIGVVLLYIIISNVVFFDY